MASRKRIIKSAVDDILSTHGIVDSGYEGSLRDLDISQIRNIMYDKFRGNQEYLKKAHALSLINDNSIEVPELLHLKEDFFRDELTRIRGAVNNNSVLGNFSFDRSQVGGSFELQYNEYQRQLRNFADEELKAPNAILRQKIAKLDPNYNFGRFDKLSWERQNQIMEDELSDLQSYAIDVSALRSEIKSYNPNFDFSRADSMNLYSQFRYLGKHAQRYQNKSVGMTALRDRLAQMDNAGFNELWNSTDAQIRRDVRLSWGDQGSIEKYRGTYYRAGIDDQLQRERAQAISAQELAEAKAKQEQRLEEQQRNKRDIFAEARKKIDAVHAVKDDPVKLAQEWNKLNNLEKNEYHTAYGEVHEFGDGKYAAPWGVDLSNQSPEVQAAYADYLERRQRAIEAGTRDSMGERIAETRYQRERANELYGDRTVAQFEPTETEPVGVAEAEQTSDIWRPKEQPSQTEAAVNETNAIAAERTEMNTVGETQTANIERRAANSILAADTARSYVFGYRQRALLGMMGTMGGISLMEAAMSGPSAETIERRRRLTEERRLRQLGY